METQNLKNFIDGIVEAAYQAKCFNKEDVQSILITANLIKSQLDQADDLQNENTARSITIENLEAENKLLKDKFNVTDSDIENFKTENVTNEIEVPDFEEVSNHSQNGHDSKFKKRLAEEMAKSKK